MTRTISCISGKGGVGKTTLVSNIGTALVELGKNVIIIDANLTTPNLGLHLGIPLYPTTLHNVLKGEAYATEAVYLHSTGIKIIPASISVDALKDVDASKLKHVIKELVGRTELILIDSAAGLGKEAIAAVEAADEIIIITNPELTAVTDALKTVKVAEKAGIDVLGVVVNRVKSKKHELGIDEIHDMLDLPVLAVIPEDSSVNHSLAAKSPVVHHSPKSKSAKEFKKLAAAIVGESYTEEEKTLLKQLFGWLRRR